VPHLISFSYGVGLKKILNLNSHGELIFSIYDNITPRERIGREHEVPNMVVVLLPPQPN
jgi:hypothetical protein